MAVNVYQHICPSREERLGSITGYVGTLKDLTEKGIRGCLRNRDRCFNTSGQCAHFDAVDQLAAVTDSVVIDHAPQGCAAGYIMWNTFGRRLAPMIGKNPRNVNVISTNMTETDTIFGASEKLKRAIQFANNRYHPKVIFVTGSCTSGIIAEDIPSIIAEIQPEIGVPIAYCSCEGIRSKMWSSGFDAAQHAMVKTMVKPPRRKSNTVNFVVFWPTVNVFLEPALARLDLKPLYISGLTGPENHEFASESVATVGQCGVLSSYYGGALQEHFGVPFLQEHFPYGISGFESWYMDLAVLVGKEAEARQYIGEQREKYEPEIHTLRQKLKGVRALVALGSGMAFEIVHILRDLDMEVVHTVAFHYDPVLDNNDGKINHIAKYAETADDLDVSIADSQQHELYKLLLKHKPDIVFSRAHGSNIWGVYFGASTVEYGGASHALYGYAGIVELGNRIVDELSNKNFVKLVAKHFVSPFSKAFDEMENFAYLEREVI
jgi:nitrogenase molybdenum-iron protein alpha chain